MMRKRLAALVTLGLGALAACGATNTTTAYRIAELSSDAAIDVAKRHHAAAPDSFLAWHYANYPLLWVSPPPNLTENAAVCSTIDLAQCDRLAAADVALTHFPSAPGPYLVWHEAQYSHLWVGSTQPRGFLGTSPRVVAADSSDVFLWVGFKQGELDTTANIYGETASDVCKAWDPDSSEFLRRTTVHPISYWPDGSVMDAHVSFFAPRADTFYLRTDSLAASLGPDTLFTTSVVVPFLVWVDDSAGTGADTLTFTAATPDPMRVPEVGVIKHTPNYTEQQMFPMTEVTYFDSLEFHVYQRTYLSGETRTWLTAYNNAPIESATRYQPLISDLDSFTVNVNEVPTTFPPSTSNIRPVIGITMAGTDSLRIRYADDMYWGDLATACTSGVVGDSIWWDGMVNDSSWAYGVKDGDTTVVGGAGSWPYDTVLRAREKVSWQIVTGGNQNDAEPVHAYLIPDEDGFNRYTDLDLFGKVAPFSYEADPDSIDVWYEAQVQTAVSTLHDRYLGGRVNSGVDSTEFGGEKLLQVAFWMNPRMHALPFKDWDTKFFWALEGHSMAEEYEISHGMGTQFVRTAGAAHDSLPTDFAEKALDLGYAWTWGHAQQGFYHTDGDTTADGSRNEPLNWIGEWQMGHPTHSANGLGSVGRPSDYTDIAHFNGRNLLQFYRLTGDPVIGEQAYDVIDRVRELVECTMTCSSCGSCPEQFLNMEERAGANHIWLLADWYAFTGDAAVLNEALQFAIRTTTGNDNHGAANRPFLNTANPFMCKKKAWMIARLMSSMQELQDVAALRGATADLSYELGLWAEFVESWLIDAETDWSAVATNWDATLGDRTSYHLASTIDGPPPGSSGDCCPTDCSATGGVPPYGDPEIAAWDLSVANALVGIAGVEQDLIDELFYAGTYYAGGENAGLPWSYYRLLASTGLTGSGQRYLHERYHE